MRKGFEKMIERIKKRLEERLSEQTDSRMASEEDVSIAWLIQKCEDLRKVAILALDYIDTLPKYIVLTVMPGFDREWADAIIRDSNTRDILNNIMSIEKLSLCEGDVIIVKIKNKKTDYETAEVIRTIGEELYRSGIFLQCAFLVMTEDQNIELLSEEDMNNLGYTRKSVIED
jgi:hypothetical protein